MKTVLKGSTIVSAQSLAASFNSSVQMLSQADVLSLLVVYSGSPVGSLEVQTCLNYNTVTGLGDWVTLPVTQSIPTAVSPILIDISGGNYQAMRLVYTRSSGTGSMTVYMAYKRIGD